MNRVGILGGTGEYVLLAMGVSEPQPCMAPTAGQLTPQNSWDTRGLILVPRYFPAPCVPACGSPAGQTSLMKGHRKPSSCCLVSLPIPASVESHRVFDWFG